MKLIVLYRPNSEHARITDEFITNFERHSGGIKADLQDFDSKEGQATASLYGIMQHPAIIALRDDGELMKAWEGPMLPLMDEVASYLR
jgi:hypothetical protein